MQNTDFPESKKLHDKLNSLAKKIQKLNIDITSELKKIGYTHIEDAKRKMLFLPDHLRNYSELLKKSKEEFNSCILSLYKQSLRDNYFWQYCPPDVYESHFKNRLQEFTQKFPDSSLDDFIEREIHFIEADLGNENFPNAHEPGIKYIKEKETDYSGIIFHLSPSMNNLDLSGKTISLSFTFPDILKEFSQIQSIKIEFLKSQLQSNNIPEQNTENWHLEIFRNPESFRLFSEFISEADKNSFIRETSYIYWKMHDKENPSLIHSFIKPINFRTWFNENYPDWENISETKTFLESKTFEREKRYSRLKNNIFR
jgi:hypothetical protein